MKNIVVSKTLPAGLALIAFFLAGSLSTVLAQSTNNRTIDQAQRAVRQRIVSQEGGRNVTVLFNTDAQTDSTSRNEVRVRGTGSFSRGNDLGYANPRDNDQRNNDSRNNAVRSKDFSYEAVVNNRSRYGSVSGVRYDLRDGWSGNGRDNNGRDNNGRYNNGRDNNGRDNNGWGSSMGNRPNGRVSYSGPIMNRHSNKALDVTERSNQDGANIQQWSYSDQPNQNWDVIDLGNGEAAIISRQSGRALTVQGGRDSNGATIIQQSWRGSPQQRWRLEQIGGDYYRIVSVDNGKCLDVTQEGKQDGANIQLWDYANHANQQWRLRR
ncbi:MAG TPA: RICIN domain-containing protein [Blastocatellia bacterium]|nr:RICIN domain-containing protein [Blastocatellia bacterium]